MASPAHCFYCFECLDASFERRDPPSLQKILDLYDQFLSSDDVTSKAREPTAASDDEDGQNGSDNELEEDRVGGDRTRRPAGDSSSDRARPQLPSISRLQASTSSSRSSSASSPSTVSANSSQSHLTGSSSATSMSARPLYASRLSVSESYPLFVTWNTLSRSGHKSLRGCIGTFEALPLSTGLQTYALASAFDDTRFSPIPSSLVPSLACSLTLLADFEPCIDAMDWSLGTHGLRISFTWKNRRHGATYLPDVAVEQGWNKEETLESLMKKAGWDGGYGHGVARRLLRGSSRTPEQHSSKPWDEVNDFRVVRYTGLKSSATYGDWKEWKDWVEVRGESLR
jgi:AMME syndrome candidate gene 1 protein